MTNFYKIYYQKRKYFSYIGKRILEIFFFNEFIEKIEITDIFNKNVQLFSLYIEYSEFVKIIISGLKIYIE